MEFISYAWHSPLSVPTAPDSCAHSCRSASPYRMPHAAASYRISAHCRALQCIYL